MSTLFVITLKGLTLAHVKLDIQETEKLVLVSDICHVKLIKNNMSVLLKACFLLFLL